MCIEEALEFVYACVLYVLTYEGRTRGGKPSFIRTVGSHLRKLSTDRAQRPLFLISIATIFVAIGSLSYASLSGCLGSFVSFVIIAKRKKPILLFFSFLVLVSSSVQLLFRALGFLVVLNSQILNREKSNLSFSYGYILA